ncbi:hypothetical protein AAG565_02955 [Fontimonas sp. SYSU GA230001]|uniref:hypothetical protein n=1 Tax=Fontimonas sp. SYSU GA230001 TaxID=3142450 RepID=UPI0032B4CBAE
MKAFRAWALMLAAVLAGCGDGSIQSPDFTTQLVSLRVEVDRSNPALGETVQFTAIGTFTNPPGSATETYEQAVTNVNWTSSNDSVLTVSASGAGTTVAQGTVTVTGERDGVSDDVVVSVGAPRLTSLVIEPPAASIPLGGATNYFARGRYTDNVTRDLPPGSTVNWTIVNPDIATLTPTTGVTTRADSTAIGSTTVRATTPAPGGGTLSANAGLTVTGATLSAVEYVKPAGFTKTDDNKYTVFVGDVPFEIYGRFSDNSVQQLSGANYTVNWSSSAPAVINNPGSDAQFQALSLGSADVTGRVTNPPGAVPDSAVANVTVAPVNQFCVTEFVNPPAVARASSSNACVAPACTVSQPGNVVDGNLESYATLTVNLGLLMQASLGIDVYDTTQQKLVVGQRAGFAVSRPSSLLSLDLLGSLTIDTLQCAPDNTCTVVESFDGQSTLLGLDLLGLIGGQEVSLLSTPPLAQSANGLRLIYQADALVALLTAVNVHTACPVAVPPQ